MMPLSLMMPLALFSFVGAITPGPNNVMLASSGLNHGVVRTIPHMCGVVGGFALMMILVGLGLGTLFAQWPGLHRMLQAVCAVYLLYLAWKIATAQPTSAQSEGSQPLSVLQAAAFQWINPKAWTYAMSVVAVYVPPTNFFLNLCVAAAISALVTAPAVWVWTLFGAALRRWLQRPMAVRRFNVAMALLLVVSLYPLIQDI